MIKCTIQYKLPEKKKKRVKMGVHAIVWHESRCIYSINCIIVILWIQWRIILHKSLFQKKIYIKNYEKINCLLLGWSSLSMDDEATDKLITFSISTRYIWPIRGSEWSMSRSGWRRRTASPSPPSEGLSTSPGPSSSSPLSSFSTSYNLDQAAGRCRCI